MNQPPHATPPVAPMSLGNPTDSSARLDAPDVMHLLRLMGELSSLRSDPRTWRRALLTAINQILPATASAAFILKNVTSNFPFEVVSVFDAGFKGESQHQIFLNEFNAAPFCDPFSRTAFNHFLKSNGNSFTAARSDLIDDEAWYGSSHVQQYRRGANIDDCLLSLWKGTERGYALVLCAFRAWRDPNRFSPRATTLIDTLHAGLDWMYRTEEAMHRLNRAAALSPRLRQTLECLLAGDTERQSALKMSLSIHTVHDYVKMLYNHFGVSSRGELIARWVQAGGQLPPRAASASPRAKSKYV